MGGVGLVGWGAGPPGCHSHEFACLTLLMSSADACALSSMLFALRTGPRAQ